MASDDRVAAVFLVLSVLLHLGLLIPLPSLQPREAPSKAEQPRVKYVVRIPQPTVAMSPLTPPPVATSQPRLETPPVATAQPRTPQPLERPQSRQEPTSVPPTPQPPVKPVEIQRADQLAPRQPSTLKPHATAVRRQTLPPLPEVAQAPVKPVGVETVNRPIPRQPSTQWQQTAVPQPQAKAPGERDPLATYLAEVRAAIERHKYYPAAARRAGITGHAVLQFVILPDGRVIAPNVAESNGHAAFGAAALEALRRAGPMPAFPETIAQERLLVQVPIAYQLME